MNKDAVWFEAYMDDRTDKKWDGFIVPDTDLEGPGPYEIDIRGQGSVFHAIIGVYSWGRYLCIPEYNVGIGLARLGDVSWNRSKLISSTSLNEFDSSSVACALAALEGRIDL